MENCVWEKELGKIERVGWSNSRGGRGMQPQEPRDERKKEGVAKPEDTGREAGRLPFPELWQPESEPLMDEDCRELA